MPMYEYVYLMRGDLSSSQVEDIAKKYKDLVESYKGKVSKVEQWGLRSLAYKIKKNKKAHYTLMNLDVSVECLKELQRNMSVNENILRFLSIKVDKLDNGQSCMLRSGKTFDRNEKDSYFAKQNTEQETIEQ